jgi:hypothetical protein
MTPDYVGKGVVAKKFVQRGPDWIPFVEDPETGALKEVTWAPQAGSQYFFLKDPTIEVLYEGTRGPGKTDTLIMDFCQDVGVGWGAEWRGVLFRQTHPQLRDVIEKSKKWVKRIWPDAFFNEIKTFWEFPQGERLYFSHFDTPSQYSNYHGHAYPWIGWEELTTWPSPDCYKVMFSCSRSTAKGMPRKVRSTTNPYGVGHNWVKMRFQLPVPPGHILGKVIDDAVDEKGNKEPPRRAIHGYLDENKLLLHADPDYKQRIRAAARNSAELAAWMDGNWDIVAGGMFDDIWYEHRKSIVVDPFTVPGNWKIFRAYDHGSSKPFSVGWFAESDGSDVKLSNGKTRATVRGDLFMIHEWYGWRGQPNEGVRLTIDAIARGIIEREILWGLRDPNGKWRRVRPGPADSAIFDPGDDGDQTSIADDFAKSQTINGIKHKGIRWERADKGPGSRKQGWEQIRKRLAATSRPKNGFRETPGLFIVSHCTQWLRTVPVMPRDDLDIDDVDDDSEDHAGDMTRYMVRRAIRGKLQTRTA